MKFPRNARIFRGHLDLAPFASMFFLLVIFVMLGSLLYTPGVRVQLPVADDLPGTDHPVIAVAVDHGGRLFFQNQIIGERELKFALRDAVRKSPEPLTLVVHADRNLKHEDLVRLTLLARDAGIHDALLATLPRMYSAPPGPAQP
jgi:biopolymer transport protein ExbD